MTGLGVYFALTVEQADRLLGAIDPVATMEIVEEFEDTIADEWQLSTDKAWDALHRCFTNERLEAAGGIDPLSAVVLGGQRLDAGDDYFVSFLPSDQAREIARALPSVTEPWLRQRYFALNPADYDGPHGEDDFAYTWENFAEIRDFFHRVAQADRSIVFTVDG